MPVKKAPVVAAEKRILKGRERRFWLIRGDNGADTVEPLGSTLVMMSSMVIFLGYIL